MICLSFFPESYSDFIQASLDYMIMKSGKEKKVLSILLYKKSLWVVVKILVKMLSKLNPMAKEFVPSSIANGHNNFNLNPRYFGGNGFGL
ncbi:hypothetical protein LWI29_005185 [Acer saccharum]|uniref:Uncharacterized protein n=1 Tax=Acer saccharum TaxID=4024 RepID=A0AA39RV62_ACESA|nr:hypothetical protein LWI29_005185 [Acer saccharum]